jgi:hypothetical protein
MHIVAPDVKHTEIGASGRPEGALARVLREIIEREGLQGVWFDGTGAACTNRRVDIMNLSVRVT